MRSASASSRMDRIENAMKPISRRGLLAQSTLAAAAGAASAFAAEPAPPSPALLKVLITGAHPDDPESGCGGTIARYTDAGHAVTVLYLTRGEGGIKGKTHDEAAAIRSAEAETACQSLKARP